MKQSIYLIALYFISIAHAQTRETRKVDTSRGSFGYLASLPAPGQPQKVEIEGKAEVMKEIDMKYRARDL